MPRRLLRADGHDRNRSLGWLATWWIETFCVHGPGAVIGQPVRLTDEYTGFIVDCYVLDSRGRRLYDSAFLSRPKGCNKSGLAADLVMFEAFGPARFAGFAVGGETYEFLGQTYTYQPGEPMGQTVVSPDVRILATEEEQAGAVPLRAGVRADGEQEGRADALGRQRAPLDVRLGVEGRR
jgi:hypothetical protein